MTMEITISVPVLFAIMVIGGVVGHAVAYFIFDRKK